MNRVVPISMKSMPFQVEACHLRIRDFLSLGVPAGVEFASHLQSMSGPCGPNQIYDDRQTLQRPTSPVPADERKQPVLDLVPLACSGREMTYRNRHPHLIGQPPEFPFPQAGPGSVASPRIGCDQQGLRLRIGWASHGSPPPSNALDSKGRRVVVDANAHPTLIACQVIDPIGNGLSLPSNHEVVHQNSPGMSLASPFPACILEIPNQFLLLGVHRNNRLAGAVLSNGLPIDVFKLCIAVRVLLAFTRFAVGLQTVTFLPQDISHDRKTYAMPHLLKPTRQRSKTLRRPSKRRLRVSPRVRFHQRFQVRHQPRILLRKLFPTSPGTANTRGLNPFSSRAKFFQTTQNGGTRYTRSLDNPSHTSAAKCLGFRGNHQPTASFVEYRFQRSKLFLQRSQIHT